MKESLFMLKKIDLLINAMKLEDWKKALSIAAKFHDLGVYKADIVRAHECIHYPDFYKQLGKNPEKLIQKGITALKIRYASKLS